MFYRVLDTPLVTIPKIQTGIIHLVRKNWYYLGGKKC